MAEMQYGLVAYLEILTPAGEPDGAAWASLSRRLHSMFTDVNAELGARSSFQLGNCLVRVQHPDAPELGPVALLLVLLELAALQAMLSRQGVFVRGAVADGEVQVRGESIVGPGVRAAQEQARQERVPRIVVVSGLVRTLAPDRLIRVELREAETIPSSAS